MQWNRRLREKICCAVRNGTLKVRQISSNILFDGGMNWTRIINVKHWADAIVRQKDIVVKGTVIEHQR
ncbi:unnamed protein product [Brugia pahangi]|uniref:BON domain-containing protein n=1 Tax=Brugia pahangi TaxID=6280 RepID=A0A0N4TXC9_BRUPA|nr:unnamed protein product [Brugia pahangi]